MRKLLLPILVFALVLSSCTDDLTSLNENPKGASDVPADPLFSNALVSLGTITSSVDYNYNIFNQYLPQYWAATSYPDESQYNLTGRGIPSDYWSRIYREVLNDLDESSKLIAEAELIPDAQKTVMQAQIEVASVLAYYQLVTTFGNIPYSQALDPDNPSPAFDGQAEIYSDLMSRLNTAISNLGSGSSGFNASADIFYGGNVVAWERFANSLKMRMAMTVADVPGEVDFNPQAAFEAAEPNAFSEPEHSLAINFVSSPPHTNPVWESLVQSGRNDFVPANTLIEFMNNYDDPRRKIHFTQIDTTDDGVDNPEYVGGLYGANNDYTKYSHMKGPLLENDFEGMLLDYTEVEFLRAEAIVRGWNVVETTSGTAQEHYENAVESDMQYWSNASTEEEITQQEIDAYLDPLSGPAAFPATGSDEQLKAIAEQKWLAFYVQQGQQAWIEWRRFDHPTLNFANNPGAATEDDIPVRLIYPVDEQNLNEENWEQASSAIGGDETSTLLFWDTEYASAVN